MLKKLIDKFIMKSERYLTLKNCLDNALKEAKISNENYKFILQEVDDRIKNITHLENILSNNKTTARRIIREVNKLIKRDEIVNAQKKIKELCNEIIKGE